MRAIILACAVALGLAACATKSAPTPDAPLDADPNSLQIEIGRYSALLGQVVEHTGVSYDHVSADSEDGPHGLMVQLNAATADYNAVRASLCASRTGATTYVAIRTESCTAGRLSQTPINPLLTYEMVARRSRAAGGPILHLWDAVCTEAKRLQPADQKDEPVCPME